MLANANGNIPSSLKAGDPFHQKLLDIIKSNSIKDEVKEITVHSPEELKGQHFVGATLYVKIILKDPCVKELNLFAKTTNNDFMKAATVKETAFYNQFLPKARDFCKNKYKGSEGLLDCFPKCWYGDDDLIVLDNIVLNDGWIMLDKLKKQDLFTAKMVLKNLAGFHAASYVFMEEECGGPDKIETEVMPELVQELLFKDGGIMVKQMIEASIKNSINVLEVYGSKLEEGSVSPKSPNDHADVQEAIKLLQSLSSSAEKIYSRGFASMKRKPQDKFVVLNHGDFHNNNLLFKMDKEGKKVRENIFVDMQCTRLSSPNYDIPIYLHTTVKGHVRRAHLHELLQHYYDSLEESLALFGGRKCPWPFSDLLDDFKSSNTLAFFIGLQFEIAFNALSDLDASELGGSGDDFMDKMLETVTKWIQNNPQKAMECVGEIVETVKEFKKLGGIDLLLND